MLSTGFSGGKLLPLSLLTGIFQSMPGQSTNKSNGHFKLTIMGIKKGTMNILNFRRQKVL